MDIGGHRESGRIRFDNLREDHSPWNMVNLQHQVREHNNLLNMNKKYLNILAERDAAIEERNRALFEKKKALDERESAISQRNLAIRERNEAILERDNALNALRHSLHNNPHPPNPTTTGFGVKQAPVSQTGRADDAGPYSEMQILDALCRTVAAASQGGRKRTKEDSNGTTANKGNKRSEPGRVLKVKNDWDGQVLGLNRVDYDESVMPVPGCSCTGVFRHCYRWGNGGWQSACCTTTVSAYPLPPVPNRKYARMGGRKMSGSAFSKLLSRLAAEGFDFSVPVDLKDRWSKHGTNRYITIK